MHGQRILQVSAQGLTKEWDMTKWLKNNNWCMTSIHKYLLHKWTKDYFKVIFIPLEEFISRIWRAWLLSFLVFFFLTYILFLWISVFSSKSKKLKSKFLTNASPDLKWRLLSCVWLFAVPWTGQNTGVETLPFYRGFSQPRDWSQVSSIAGGFFISWATREAMEYWSG